ncbi:RALBP1 associated Eps domain containing isoform X2 [Halictus rubicundus]|uniref:RALBP1 associated Eps domain containing isoform X2 n=1 Tax=Halictus rubicundus TaxID=77578 RepID=UPI004036AB7A
MDWDTITMANLHLTITEHQYYEDIFSYCCENTDSESVPVIKVAELLRSANMPGLVTMKILDICFGTKAPCIATHLGKKQFYGLLKLVAAHQAGFNIRKDLITMPLDVITLPKFTWPTSGDEDDRRSSDSNRAVKGRHAPESTTESESEAESPRETGGSTDSPTPTNSVIQDRSNDIGGKPILDSVSDDWQGLSEELRQLLGTEEESSERHSSDEADADGECSEFPPEVWIITDEQCEYYTNQFSQLQLDPDGLLHGHIAKTFFQKSGLPFPELSRIWRLADITRDGALSLEEFLVAMHLVVLRRNHVPLPNVLPLPLLNPLFRQKTERPPIPSNTTTQKTVSNTTKTTFEKRRFREWTKFVDSPTGTSSSLTIPGLQLVNFDFQKSDVEKDPKILHPVPLRLTPEAAILASGANGNSNSCTTLGDDDLQHTATAILQRPLIKKPSAPNEEGIIVTPKKEPPPPPPPRPYRTHARSSSLDLNKLGKNGQNFLGAPPLIPPRISPGISELPENPPLETITPQPQQFTGVCGAFHIYRKPSPKRDGGDEDTPKDEVEESKKLTLQELREKNAELRLVCEELTRELASALQERINLRAKLLLLT